MSAGSEHRNCMSSAQSDRSSKCDCRLDHTYRWDLNRPILDFRFSILDWWIRMKRSLAWRDRGSRRFPISVLRFPIGWTVRVADAAEYLQPLYKIPNNYQRQPS